MAIVPRLTEEELERFQPLHDWVVVRKNKAPETTEHGIIVPEDRRDYQSKHGVVVKVGPCDNLRRKGGYVPVLNPGDEVLYSAFAGMETPMPEGYLIMRATEILAKLEKKETP
jgi:co-chaperonin GroES (HSP10)